MAGAGDVKTGSCLCGAVTYEIAGPLSPVVYCHCSQCRRQSGHFYATTNVARADLRLIREDGLAWFRSSERARRGFCKMCGSPLFWQHDGTDRIAILAGGLASPTGLVEGRHIFVADKGDYYTIDDGLPQFQGDG